MRFSDEQILIKIKLLDTANSSDRSPKVLQTVSFRSFITNINESFKYTFKPSTSRLFPVVRYNNVESYYMDLALDFDLLAETESEVKNNNSSVILINNHITTGIREYLNKGGSYSQNDAKTLTNPTFIIEFNGFVYRKKYKGYITQFDAKPDLDKGYWLADPKGHKDLLPLAYKVSLKFESSDLSSEADLSLSTEESQKIDTAIKAAKGKEGTTPVTLKAAVEAVLGAFDIGRDITSEIAEDLIVKTKNEGIKEKKQFLDNLEASKAGFTKKLYDALIDKVSKEVK